MKFQYPLGSDLERGPGRLPKKMNMRSDIYWRAFEKAVNEYEERGLDYREASELADSTARDALADYGDYMHDRAKDAAMDREIDERADD